MKIEEIQPEREDCALPGAKTIIYLSGGEVVITLASIKKNDCLMPWNQNGKIMNEEDDMDTELDFIKKIDEESDKAYKVAEGVSRVDKIADGVGAIAGLVLFVCCMHKFLGFLTMKMGEALNASETGWYIIYTSLLLLSISLIVKIFIKMLQGNHEQS